MKMLNDEQFKKMYKELHLINDDDTFIQLHRSCKNRNQCWQNAEDRIPADGDEWGVSRPWIGRYYDKLRLHIIGINMNEYAGYNGIIKCVNIAIDELNQNIKKNLVSPTYGGTNVFSRIGTCAAIFAEKEKLMNPNWVYSTLPGKEIANGFDFIAYNNHIKCAPIDNDSKPTNEMWDECGKYILRGEIEFINPKTILLFGISENFKNFNNNILDEKIELNRCKEISSGIGRIAGREIKIYVVPHPRVLSDESIDDLYNLVKQ